MSFYFYSVPLLYLPCVICMSHLLLLHCNTQHNLFSSHLSFHFALQKNPNPSRQSLNNILDILTWSHSSAVHDEQMGRCDCHVNSVFQSIMWGAVVITARVMSHGKRLKVSYDLSWITGRPCNLLRLADTLWCVLKYAFSVSTWPEREWGEDYLAAADIYQPALTDVPYVSCFSLKPNFSFIFRVDKSQHNSG